MNDFRDYVGIDFTPYFQHYGVGHEKGGHSGRYPWGSGERPKQELEYKRPQASRERKKQAKSAQKRLNRLDDEQVQHIAKMNKARKDYDKAISGAYRAHIKAVKKNPGLSFEEFTKSKEGNKYADKGTKAMVDYNMSKAALEKSEKETWKTIAELAQAGYTIDSKKVMKDAAGAKAIAAQVLGGYVGQQLYRNISGNTGLIEGNKFKVKDTPEGEKASVRIDNRDLQSQYGSAKQVEKEAGNTKFRSEESKSSINKLMSIDEDKLGKAIKKKVGTDIFYDSSTAKGANTKRIIADMNKKIDNQTESIRKEIDSLGAKMRSGNITSGERRRYENLFKKYYQVSDKIKESSRDKVSTAILKDLGYEATPENIKYIENKFWWAYDPTRYEGL